jgi:hypothetical protein
MIRCVVLDCDILLQTSQLEHMSFPRSSGYVGAYLHCVNTARVDHVTFGRPRSENMAPRGDGFYADREARSWCAFISGVGECLVSRRRLQHDWQWLRYYCSTNERAGGHRKRPWPFHPPRISKHKTRSRSY